MPSDKLHTPDGARWRHAVLALVVAVLPIAVFSGPPIVQDPAYHDFADQRGFAGLPNFLDVASSLSFLLVGLAGVVVCRRRAIGASRAAWVTLFAGVAAVGVGSVYYHLDPNDRTLAWDRLPITVGFMGLFAALVTEYVAERLGRALLLPAVLLGCASVALWQWTGDLRLYLCVQFVPLATLPVLLLLYRPAHTHRWLLVLALLLYALAKVAESYDAAIFSALGHALSGHTLKHLLATLACIALAWMLGVRRPLGR